MSEHAAVAGRDVLPVPGIQPVGPMTDDHSHLIEPERVATGIQ